MNAAVIHVTEEIYYTSHIRERQGCNRLFSSLIIHFNLLLSVLNVK